MENSRARPNSAVQKNRLMLSENMQITEPLLSRIKPNNVPKEKEKLYEEVNKLRLLNNKLQDELMRHRGRIRQHLEELNSRDDKIMQLTAGLEKPGYKQVHLVAELSKRLRESEMKAEDAQSECERWKKKKTSKDAKVLRKQLEEKNQDLDEFKTKYQSLEEINAKLLQEISDLEGRIARLEDEKRELNAKFRKEVSELLDKNREKDNKIENLLEKNQELLESVEDYKKKCSEFEKMNRGLLDQIDKAQKENQNLKDQLKFSKDREDLYKKQIEDYQKKSNFDNNELDRLRLDFQELHKKLKESDAREQELKRKLENSAFNEKNLNSQLDDSASKIRNLENLLKNLQSQLDDSVFKLKTLENELKIMQEKLEKTKVFDKRLCFPLNLPSYFQFFLISLQISKISPKDLFSIFLQNISGNMIVSSELLIQSLNNLKLVGPARINSFKELCDDIIQKDSTKNSVLFEIYSALGYWEVFDEKSPHKKHLLHIFALNYHELIKNCLSLQGAEKKPLNLHEFYQNCLMAQIFLSSSAWCHFICLVYSNLNEIYSLDYQKFFSRFFDDLEEVSKEAKKEIKNNYFKIISVIGKTKEINLGSIFYRKSKEINYKEFHLRCEEIGVHILPRIAEVVLKYVENDGNLKKKKFRKILKKFDYSDKSSASSSSGSDSDKKNKISSRINLSQIEATKNVQTSIKEPLNSSSISITDNLKNSLLDETETLEKKKFNMSNAINTQLKNKTDSEVGSSKNLSIKGSSSRTSKEESSDNPSISSKNPKKEKDSESSSNDSKDMDEMKSGSISKNSKNEKSSRKPKNHKVKKDGNIDSSDSSQTSKSRSSESSKTSKTNDKQKKFIVSGIFPGPLNGIIAKTGENPSLSRKKSSESSSSIKNVKITPKETKFSPILALNSDNLFKNTPNSSQPESSRYKSDQKLELTKTVVGFNIDRPSHEFKHTTDERIKKSEKRSNEKSVDSSKPKSKQSGSESKESESESKVKAWPAPVVAAPKVELPSLKATSESPKTHSDKSSEEESSENRSGSSRSEENSENSENESSQSNNSRSDKSYVSSDPDSQSSDSKKSSKSIESSRSSHKNGSSSSKSESYSEDIEASPSGSSEENSSNSEKSESYSEETSESEEPSNSKSSESSSSSKRKPSKHIKKNH